MTKEEAIKQLKELRNEWSKHIYAEGVKKRASLDMAIKALEQEPKIGHWIEHECEEMREKGYYRCSVCNHGYQRYTKGIRKSDVPYIDGQEYIIWHIDHYCPNCGAKMIEPQESENI